MAGVTRGKVKGEKSAFYRDWFEEEGKEMEIRFLGLLYIGCASLAEPTHTESDASV